jgi:hypothetical protein
MVCACVCVSVCVGRTKAALCPGDLRALLLKRSAEALIAMMKGLALKL